MRNWKFLIPLNLIGCGLGIMMATAFWANSSTRIASWPSVEIGPIRLIFFGGFEESISQEAESVNFLSASFFPILNVLNDQKGELTSHSLEIFQETTHHEHNSSK